MEIYLGLGSNLGNREENIRRAIELLVPAIQVVAKSAIYRTTPMYLLEQAEFLNMVVKAKTDLSAAAVFRGIKSIEKNMGEHTKNQPRIIDIDILFYGSDIFETPKLLIPHPKIAERAFVLVPLAEVAADFVHPVLGATIAKLKERLGDTSSDVRKTNIAL